MNSRLTINIPADLRRRAKARAVLEGRTLTDVIRERLEEYAAGLDDQTLATEFAAWEAASDEALINFEASLS
jgi:predicted DNA-binding protein